jgi:hypothetical protein
MKLYEEYLQEFQSKLQSISNVKHINLIDKYHLPKNKTLLFGGSVLAVHGLRSNNDLDVAVTKDVFNSLRSNSEFKIGIASTSGEQVFHDKSGQLEIYYSLGIPGLNFVDLFKRADNISGYLFLSVVDMISWKKKMGRPKDLEDVKLLTTLQGVN